MRPASFVLRVRRGALVLALGGFAAVPLAAQQDSLPRAGGPGALPADTLELVFEREVFTYPSYERRNPFQPLTGEESAGPRFEDLVLMGRILSSNPANSVALVGARAPGAREGQEPTRTFRLRVGDVIGNARILEIREQLVLVEVEEFGLRETRVLELRRTTVPMVPAAEAVPPAPEAAPDSTPADPAPDGDGADPSQNVNGGGS